MASLPVDPDRLYPAGILQALPETDKHSYIDAYPLAERCVDGRVRFKLPRTGMWMIKAVHMIEAPAGADADWVSYWASLTFEIREAATSGPAS